MCEHAARAICWARATATSYKSYCCQSSTHAHVWFSLPRCTTPHPQFWLPAAAPTSGMPMTGRSTHSAVALDGSHLLIFGGELSRPVAREFGGPCVPFAFLGFWGALGFSGRT